MHLSTKMSISAQIPQSGRHENLLQVELPANLPGLLHKQAGDWVELLLVPWPLRVIPKSMYPPQTQKGLRVWDLGFRAKP